MKSIITVFLISMSLVSAFSASSLLFSQVQNKRQITTPTMSSTMAPTQPANTVEANTCTCVKDSTDAVSDCLSEGNQPNAFSNGLLCWCYDETIQIPDTCIFPTGPATNQSSVCDWTWWLQYYQLFAFDSLNISQFASIEGRLAAKNNVFLNNFKVNYQNGNNENVSDPVDTSCDAFGDNDWKFAVVAGNNLSLASGKVYSGDIVYGGFLSNSSLDLSNTCESMNNATILDFGFAKNEIIRISNALKALPLNGEYSVSAGVITLRAPAQINNGDTIVWNILISELVNLNNVQFVGFPDPDRVKALVFNLITPSGFQIPNGFSFGLPSAWDFESLANSGYSNKLIFNFGELAATLTVSTSAPDQTRSFYGTVLAPNVNLSCGSSRIRIVGSAFLNSFSGSYLIAEQEQTQYCLQTIGEAPAQATTSVPVATTSIPSRR